jgi:hypothetical protein
MCLRMGADVNAVTVRGNTPLHMCATIAYYALSSLSYCRLNRAARSYRGYPCVHAILFGAHGDWNRVRLGPAIFSLQCLPIEFVSHIAGSLARQKEERRAVSV